MTYSSTKAFLAALAVMGGVFAVSAQVTNVISVTTFENEAFDPISGEVTRPAARLRYDFSYEYQWPAPNPGPIRMLNTWYTIPEDWELTNYMAQFTFDNSVYEAYMAANPTGGYGLGIGGGLNYTNESTIFTRTNREEYIVSFDARVEGLLPGVEQAGGEFQIRFDVPDDTIQPADANTDSDVLMQVNLNMNVKSNWTHFVFRLDQGNIADGKTERDFILYRHLISDPRFGVNFHMPNNSFGYDGDNAFYIDNIKLVVVETAPPPPAPPKVPFAIFDYDFDAKALWDAWSPFPGGTGWSAGIMANYWVVNNAAGEGKNGSNGYVMGMDNTAMASEPPAWAGGNTGGIGPINAAELKSGNLSDYRLVVDARVEGLAPEKLTTSATIQLHVYAPDDTILPVDVDTNRDFVTRFDLNVPDIGTNWTTYHLPLNKASIGSGTLANFTNYFASVNVIEFQLQILNSQQGGTWNFDADNKVVIDNFRLERLAVGTPPLQAAVAGNSLTITWEPPSTGTVKLQSATSPAGPWTDVAGATSPYNAATGSGSKFFRTVWVPPAQ